MELPPWKRKTLAAIAAAGAIPSVVRLLGLLRLPSQNAAAGALAVLARMLRQDAIMQRGHSLRSMRLLEPDCSAFVQQRAAAV
jgi:hypothetical protein